MKLSKQVITIAQAHELREMGVAQEVECAIFAYVEHDPNQTTEWQHLALPQYKVPSYARNGNAYTVAELGPIMGLLEKHFIASKALQKKYGYLNDMQVIYSAQAICDMLIEALRSKQVSVKKVNEILRRQ